MPELAFQDKTISKSLWATFSPRLRALFQQMDQAYDTVASQYGFACQGCEENCCLTRFYHHTFLEVFYIQEGMETLEPDIRQAARKRAQTVCAAYETADKANKTSRIMCPLNLEGRCILYGYRPMICRLHGIAHELTRPGHPPRYSPGCERFTQQTRGEAYIPFDRTRFYRQMAELEHAFRRQSGLSDRVRLTVAGIVSL